MFDISLLLFCFHLHLALDLVYHRFKGFMIIMKFLFVKQEKALEGSTPKKKSGAIKEAMNGG